MISFDKYLKNKFGCKVYKLSLDGGFTCPNRDGKIDTRGCIFCSNGGSGEFASDRLADIDTQIEQAKKLVRAKSDSGKYIAYFQNFTNTYAPVEKLEKLYMQALSREDIVALSVATRPDCLGDDVIALLKKLNSIKPVFVELGLQTIHESTAQYIRRGYSLQVYDSAVERLQKIGVHIVTHLIVGLPFESEKDIYESVKYVVAKGTHGVKLQLLHILKATDLEKDYNKGMFSCLEMEQYAKIIANCLCLLDKDTVVHRITGDGDKRILVAPLWSGDKKRVLNTINKAIREKGLVL